jgi:hypothetical protein
MSILSGISFLFGSFNEGKTLDKVSVNEAVGRRLNKGMRLIFQMFPFDPDLGSMTGLSEFSEFDWDRIGVRPGWPQDMNRPERQADPTLSRFDTRFGIRETQGPETHYHWE